MKWLVLCALAACDWSLHRMQEQPKCTTHGTLDGSACDQLPPAGIVAVGGDAVAARPPLTRAVIDRGRDRFDRMCAPCHGLAGDSDSDVSRAMTLRRPPSLVDEAARSLADDRVYFVISRGYGVMPSYGGALAPADRWAVISYVRALQAREIAVGDVPAGVRASALEEASR
jgi:mono/diheme cytochrome c family protein